MQVVLKISFLFIIGGSLGWVLELSSRRMAHGKWISPGFLVGPCLPLYGIGVVLLYSICEIRLDGIASEFWRHVVVILMITAVMTGIEYVTGLFFVNVMKVRLWDYSDSWGNVQGIICPLFSLFWGVLGALYYLFVHSYMCVAADWIATHQAFGYFVGMYVGVLMVDIGFSFHVVSKIHTWAKESKFTVRYEELKLAIRAHAENMKNKRHFVFPFHTLLSLRDELEHYKKAWIEKRK